MKKYQVKYNYFLNYGSVERVIKNIVVSYVFFFFPVYDIKVMSYVRYGTKESYEYKKMNIIYKFCIPVIRKYKIMVTFIRNVTTGNAKNEIFRNRRTESCLF